MGLEVGVCWEAKEEDKTDLSDKAVILGAGGDVPLHLDGSQTSLACSSWSFRNTTPIMANIFPRATLLSHDPSS